MSDKVPCPLCGGVGIIAMKAEVSGYIAVLRGTCPQCKGERQIAKPLESEEHHAKSEG